MPYLFCLPSLICAVALSVEDMRRRRVPRAWVACGFGAQLLADVAWAVWSNGFFTVVQALLFAALCAGIQLLLALMKPGSLGLGDVSAMLPLGLAVGAYGLGAVVCWWLAMAAAGWAFVAWWTRFDPQRSGPYRGRTPFVPVIAMSAVAAVLL